MPLPSLQASCVLELVLIASGSFPQYKEIFSSIQGIGLLRNDWRDHGSDALAARELFLGGKACSMVRHTSHVEVRVKCLGKSSGTLRMVCGGPGR